MHSQAFNLYAASVFSDHPLAMWPLDEDLGYRSLLSASPSWTLENCTASAGFINSVEAPAESVGLPDELLDVWTFMGSSASYATAMTQIIPSTDLDPAKHTAAVSGFVYLDGAAVASIEIGLLIDAVESVHTYIPDGREWLSVNHTADTTGATTIRPFIRVTFEDYDLVRSFSVYKFTAGQQSELYNSVSEGFTTLPLSSLTASADLGASWPLFGASPGLYSVVEADAYGIDDSSTGYYLLDENAMLACNSGLPMVYGSPNVTEIYESLTGAPALVLPGHGFLHENGRHKSLTAEFWLRAYETTTAEVRVFGQLDSTDGLFMDRGYMILRIGQYEGSYFVNQQYRPMIVNVMYSPQRAMVMVNGDIVIDLSINEANIELPSSRLFNTDWLGFWGHSGVSLLHIDCIAIYPYIVSSQSAKRRFVYGQAVGSSSDIVKKFGGEVSEIDFPFASFASNIIYPDVIGWSGGYFSNLDASNAQLAFPQYALPEVNFYGEDMSVFNQTRLRRSWSGVRGPVGNRNSWARWASMSWKSLSTVREADVFYDNYARQSSYTGQPYLRLKPTSAYDEVYGSIDFSNMSPTFDKVSSVHAILSVNAGEMATVSSNAYAVIMIFKDRNSSNTFSVRINTATNLIEYVYNDTVIKTLGIAVPDTGDSVFVVGLRFDELSEYYYNTIRKFFSNTRAISLSVGSDGPNNFPGKIYKVIFNNKRYDTQDNSAIFDSDGTANTLNELYPAFDADVMDYIGNYTLLFRKTNSTIEMDIGCVGYWEDSLPMSVLGSYVTNGDDEVYDVDLIQFNIDYPAPLYAEDTFDTRGFDVNTYVTLQRYDDAGKTSYTTYTNEKGLAGSRIIEFDSMSASVDYTKFRVVDGTVIVPPRTLVDFNEAYMSFHIEAKSRGIYSRPLTIGRMSVSSVAIGSSDVVKVGSQSGNAAYPFTRLGGSYMPKEVNPFLIYKESTPYLYNSGVSGITSLPYAGGILPDDIDRGISVPINPLKHTDYTFYGFHAWMMYNKSSTVTDQKVAGIKTNNESVEFSLVTETGGHRGKLVASSELLPEYPCTMHQNGQIVPNIMLTPGVWSMVTVALDEPIILSGAIGQLEFSPGIAIDNVAVYEKSLESKVDDIFESHLGLSSIVISDSSTVVIRTERLDNYSGIVWSTFSGTPT